MIDTRSKFKQYDEVFFVARGMEAGCEDGAEIYGDIRIGAPISRPSKMICVGQNYSEHIKEFGEKAPLQKQNKTNGERNVKS